jgi:hypothetical protein
MIVFGRAGEFCHTGTEASGGANVATPVSALNALQGLWFPTRMSVEGRLTAVNEPVFPPPLEVAVMTILGNTFHVTAAGEYYWTGGRLRVDPVAHRLTYVYPSLPPEWDTMLAYELVGDDLRVCSGGFPWSGPHDWESTAEYRRVAIQPTPSIRALIDSIMGGWSWTPTIVYN